jgi:hypothetical protein
VYAQTWESYPWISVGAGYENDRLLQQGAVPIVVPGGTFIDVRPGLLLSRTLGARTRLNLDAVASFERFGNDENRRLFGGALNAEMRQRFGRIGRWRLTLGANYFGDSVQEGVNRFRLGGEAALGITGRRGFIEALLGLQGRRFPDLVSPDESGALGTYTESGPSAGLTGAFSPVRRPVVALRGCRRGSSPPRSPLFASARRGGRSSSRNRSRGRSAGRGPGSRRPASLR